MTLETNSKPSYYYGLNPCSWIKSPEEASRVAVKLNLNRDSLQRCATFLPLPFLQLFKSLQPTANKSLNSEENSLLVSSHELETSGAEPKTKVASEQPSSAKLEKEAPNKALSTVEGLTTGLTVPVVTAPLDKLSVLMATRKSNLKLTTADLLQMMFTGNIKVLRPLIPGRVFAGGVFMGSAQVFPATYKQLTENEVVIDTLSLASASVCEGLCFSPVGKVVQELRTNPHAENFMKTIQKSIAKEGLKSLWRGSASQITASAAFNIAFYQLSEETKKWVETDEHGKKIAVSAKQELVNSFFAGCATSALICPFTYPFSRIAIEQRHQKVGSINPPKSFIGTASSLVKRGYAANKGIGVAQELCRGISPSIVRMPLVGGTIIFTCKLVDMVYEELTKKKRSV